MRSEHGDGEEFDLLGTSPPVQPMDEPGFATVMLDGRPTRVRTTPPPPLRRPPAPSLPTDLLARQPATLRPSRRERAPVAAPSRSARWPAYAAVIAAGILLAGFAALLIAG